MPIPTPQLLADRDRQFDDWAATVTLREFTQSFDPQTQQAPEQHSDTEIKAIIGDAPAQPATGTTGQHLNEQLTLVIKTEDLPASTPTTTRRIIHNSVEYDILTSTLSPDHLTATLTCQRT